MIKENLIVTLTFQFAIDVIAFVRHWKQIKSITLQINYSDQELL
ncbi:hypothetical protein BH11BAC6_BH11BAC6_07320 [soil metagenome]